MAQLFPRRRRSGINVIGQVASESGQGQIARGVLESLSAVGYPVATLPISFYDPARADHGAIERYARGIPFDINVFQANANVTNILEAILGPGVYAGRYNIGYWAWELDEFPDEWSAAFEVYDEIWVFSEFVREAIARKSPIPVTTVPVPLEVPTPDPAIRQRLGLPEMSFLVLFAFDANSVVARKNPWAVIRAFTAAFDKHERGRTAHLVIKVNNLDTYPSDAARLRQEMADVNGVLIEGYLSRDEMHSLIGTADAYVSLHRSEGFGLTIAEAMAMGRPTVATAYSANAEYMSNETSYPIPYRLAPIGEDEAVYRKGNVWAEADTDAAARVIRRIYENPEEARHKGRAAAEYMRNHHNRHVVGKQIAARLETIGDFVREDGTRLRHPLPQKGRLPRIELVHWLHGVAAEFVPLHDASFAVRPDRDAPLPAGEYDLCLRIGPTTGRWDHVRLYPDSGNGHLEPEAQTIVTWRESDSTIVVSFYLPTATKALRIDAGAYDGEIPTVQSALIRRIGARPERSAGLATERPTQRRWSAVQRRVT
ncbi:glycosyltransferase family 4 protein [Smaragdicoccus niigatensis]|uniref:glycosyltransferase family 4 protein n=1 Tax=Smaragdicoccus niigatensis TaxID=359359 RepID=UPI000363CAF9|nr:glycosyltransferase family 4 protein [Smaragdicoccus niigatensis]